MNRDDLPLLGFTLLVQLALGAVALAAMAPLRAFSLGDASVLTLRLLLVAGAALVAASGLSLLHLGVKAGALRALRNLRTSWLSREVLFTGLFTVLTLGAAAWQALRPHSAHFLWLVTLTGFAAVFTMSRLYQQTIRPAWMTPYTPLSFFTAAVLLGVALGAPLVLLDPTLPPVASALLLRDIALTAAGASTASLITAAVYPGDAPLRPLMTVAGTAALGLGWFFGWLPLLLVGSSLLVTAEVIGRVRFFALGNT